MTDIQATLATRIARLQELLRTLTDETARRETHALLAEAERERAQHKAKTR